MTRRPLSVAAACLALAVAAGLPPAASNPDSSVDPLVDGCQRNNTMLLGLSTPEWVYVDRAGVLADRARGDAHAGSRVVRGVVEDSRPAGEDLYVNHDFNDYTLNVRPDPAYRSLLATGNISGEDGLLHLEWEAPRIPTWAWPAVGDTVTARGSWVWDCGHWGNPALDSTGFSQFVPYDPEETLRNLILGEYLRGEGTELHPLSEIATVRAKAAGLRDGATSGVVLSRLDVWISSDGGPAQAQIDCHLIGSPNSVADRAACSQHRDVGGPRTYVLPLGPRPSPASTIWIDDVVVHPETDGARVAVPVSTAADETEGTVTVSFTLPSNAGIPHPAPASFGISVEAGWTGAAAAERHIVTLDEIHIERSLDGPSEPHLNPGNNTRGEQTADPGEWVLYAQVSGRWVQLPGIARVRDGDTVPLGIAFDFWLPAGETPALYVSGHECDVPLIDCERETYGATIADVEPFAEAGFNDRPGRIRLGFGGQPMGPGTGVYRPDQNPSATSGNENFSDHLCGPNGCYQVKATWTRV